MCSSRPVRSSQAGPHPGLRRVVERSLAAARSWRGPVPRHQLQAYAKVSDWLGASPAGLVIDGGCGTGRSTWALARRHPGALVLGVDKSLARLGRVGSCTAPSPAAGGSGPTPTPRWLRMDQAWLWRLLARDGIRAAHQTLLFPNPWPKPGHLRRRWSAHPALGAMIAVGGTLELRTNWWIYAEEMRLALSYAGIVATLTPLADPPDDLATAFELKYRASGHALWRLRCNLDAAQPRSSSSSSTATS